MEKDEQMTRAERAAEKAYPPQVVKTLHGEFDCNAYARLLFWRGYQESEKERGVQWHNTSVHPQEWETIIILCENKLIYFDASYDGEEFVIWNPELGMNDEPLWPVIGWMPQKKLEEYLKTLWSDKTEEE